jgi:predicted RNA-binding protein with PUA-like domain
MGAVGAWWSPRTSNPLAAFLRIGAVGSTPSRSRHIGPSENFMGKQIKYWLMKSEPSDYSFADLNNEINATAEWDGVRNYQARNFLRYEINVGDMVLFYHSNSKPSAVVGTAIVVKDGYPDYTAWDTSSKHPDPKSSEENPIWYMVDIQASSSFNYLVSLAKIKSVPLLADMVLVRNSRLSVQPVTKSEYEIICSLGAAGNIDI